MAFGMSICCFVKNAVKDINKSDTASCSNVRQLSTTGGFGAFLSNDNMRYQNQFPTNNTLLVAEQAAVYG